MIFTKPGEWHRYKPKKSTGWVEHYVGFTGYIAHQLFGRPWFTQKNPVVEVGHSEEILDTYYKISQIYYFIGNEVKGKKIEEKAMLLEKMHNRRKK